MMRACTSLPGCVTVGLRGLPTLWRGRPRLLFCGLVFLPAVPPGRHTWEEMARWTPATSTAWRFGRLLTAASWHVPLRVSWLAQDLLSALPPPPHGGRSLCGDGRHADTRGTQNPGGQQGRIRPHPPGFFGLRFVLVRAAWDGERVPGGLRLIRPTCHAHSGREHVWWRERVDELVPPKWATLLSVGGEAA